MEIGKLCVKIAGRDAGKKCVIVDVLEDHFVMIDGATRRRKCNIMHLEPLGESIKIKKGASHADVAKEFKKLKLEVFETKPKKSVERPKKQRKVKEKPVAEEKPTEKKPAAKKSAKPKTSTKKTVEKKK